MARTSLADWRTELDLDALEDRERLPRGLLSSVLRHESAGDPNATSRVGAGGLFQLMPPTARQYGADPYNPQQAANAAAKELGSHYKRYGGDLEHTLAAWNWGSGNLQRKGIEGMPRETRQFIRNVSGGVGERYAAADGDTVTDMPRYQGKAKEEKPSKPWVDILPDNPPEAIQAPTQAAPTQAAPASARPWVDVLPDTPPEMPSESPTRPPASAPLSGEPAGGSVAPPRQGEAPSPPAATPHQQQMAERPWYQKMWGTPSDPQAPDKVPPSTTFSPGYVEPGLEEQNPAREWAATGIELGAGIIGATAATPGGPLAMWPAGAAGQSYGRRINEQLGLRDREEPLLETGIPGVDLYASDVLNFGLGFLTEAVPIGKQLLGKTKAGKAILSAEAETKAAFQAWKEADEAATVAQKKGQDKAWEEAMGKARIKRMEYENRVKARGETIQANQAEYDAAEREWKKEGRTQILREEGDMKLYERDVADARTREFNTARTEAEATQEGYQADVAAREQTIRDQTRQDAITARREQARAASEQDLYQQDVAAIKEADVAKAQDVQAAAEGKFAGKQADIQSAQQGQQQAIQEAQQFPYSIKTGDKPGWQLYDEWRVGAKDVHASPTEAKAGLQGLRNERPATMSGAREPFSPEVERIAQDIEKAGESVSVLSVYESIKKLGKLSKATNPAVRREAAQVGEILGDMLEQSPANNAQLGAARRAWRREAAQDTMNQWMKEEGVVATDRSGRKILNPGALKKKFEREMEKPLFAKSFSPSETQRFGEFYDSLAERTPLMPSVKETRAGMPAVKPPAPSAIPAPPPPRGLTGPTPAPPEVPVPTPETLPGALADKPPGVGAPPQTTALPERPVPKAIPAEEPPPTSTHVPIVEKGAVPPEPAPVPTTRPVRGKTATGEDIPGETAAQHQQRVDEFNQARLGDRPKVLKPLLGAGAVGAMAYTLQRMGVSPTALDVMLYTGAAGIAGNVLQKHANYFLSKAMLNPKYHDLMRSAIRGDNTIDPLFYNAMLGIMTAEEKRDMPKDLRRYDKKVRR